MRVSVQDCEDLVSDIFLRALRNHGQLRGDEGAWLFSIARSRVADHYRERNASMTVTTGDIESSSHPALFDPAQGPLARLEADEFRACLHRNMQLLTEPEREVIALKFSEGLSNIQISKVLDITPNHLGVLLHRALRRLRDAMLAEAGGSLSPWGRGPT